MRHTNRPASPKQLAASRANGAKSHGPKTPEGKARSARNAVKHGFTASAFAVVRLEDIHEIDRLKSDLLSVYKPVNSQELFAVERMALAQQSMFRAWRVESGLFTTCLNETLDANDYPCLPMNKELAGDGDIQITRAQNRNYLLGEGFLRLARQSNGLSLFLRYQTLAERQYRRALEEFDRLKALRADLPEEDLPNEPGNPPDPPDDSITYASSETNPVPSETAPSTPAADPEPVPSAAVPETPRAQREISPSPRPSPSCRRARQLPRDRRRKGICVIRVHRCSSVGHSRFPNQRRADCRALLRYETVR